MEVDQITYDFTKSIKQPPYYLNYFNKIGNVNAYTINQGATFAVSKLVMGEDSIAGQKYGLSTYANPLGLAPNTDYVLRITGYVPDAGTQVYAVVENPYKYTSLCLPVYFPFAVSPIESTTIVSIGSEAIHAVISIYFQNGINKQYCCIKYVELSTQTLAGFKDWKFVEVNDKLDLMHKTATVEHLIAEWEDLNP